MIQIHHPPTYTLTFIAVQYVHSHADAEIIGNVCHESDCDYNVQDTTAEDAHYLFYYHGIHFLIITFLSSFLSYIVLSLYYITQRDRGGNELIRMITDAATKMERTIGVV